MVECDTLFRYVEAAAESSRRGRTALLVLIVASGVATAAAYNAAPYNWIAARQRVLADVVRWWPELAEGDSVAPRQWPDSAQAAFARAHRFVVARFPAPYTRDSIGFSIMREELSVIEQARVQNVILLKVPFFGVVLDINNLGLLAGFSFSVILFWFFFSLSTELRNVKDTFEHASAIGQRQLCVRLLAMRQVFTLPPHDSGSGKTLLALVIRGLLLLPVLIQLYIVRRDFLTSHFGRSISPEATNLTLSAGTGFLLLLVVLAVLCLLRSISIDALWRANTCPSEPESAPGKQVSRTGSA